MKNCYIPKELRTSKAKVVAHKSYPMSHKQIIFNIHQHINMAKSSVEYHSHRMTEIGRDLQSSSSPTQLQKQDSLEQVAQDHLDLLDVSCSQYFLMFRGNITHFCSCPLPLVPWLGTIRMILAPSSLYPPSRNLYTLIKPSLGLLFSR